MAAESLLVTELTEQQKDALLVDANPQPLASASTGAGGGEGKLWRPRRVFITADAYALPYGRAVLERAEAFGAEVVRLKGNQLRGLTEPARRTKSAGSGAGVGPTDVAGSGAGGGSAGLAGSGVGDGAAETDGKAAQRAYAAAKTTLAVVVAPPSAKKLQPIPPSADWQFHVAQGCPAHCQYCYLAGSLSGPPVTRVYANLPEILENLRGYAGTGRVTSRSAERAGEGTTFEASCYTDPLGIEHLTGALGESIRFFGRWDAPVQLRWTTKFDGVGPLVGLEHNRRTRVRFSVNAAGVSRGFEGGTANVTQRLAAMRKMALSGYPVGLTIAPIMPIEQWEEEYGALLRAAAEALGGIDGVDLTVELITHRFTPGSKEVLLSWYPKTTLDLREEARTQKRNKFGGFKYVYPKDPMRTMRAWFEREIGQVLPMARVLYWT